MAPRETIVLLGTGMMGAAMGRNLLRAGFPVRAWNRTSAKVAPLAEEGALAAASPAEAVSGAGIVLTMLADGEAIEATMAGPSGALAALGDGAVWVQSSTVGVDDTERLAAMAGQRGIQFVDAPVLGTRQPAEKGRADRARLRAGIGQGALPAGAGRDRLAHALARRGGRGHQAQAGRQYLDPRAGWRAGLHHRAGPDARRRPGAVPRHDRGQPDGDRLRPHQGESDGRRRVPDLLLAHAGG